MLPGYDIAFAADRRRNLAWAVAPERHALREDLDRFIAAAREERLVARLASLYFEPQGQVERIDAAIFRDRVRTMLPRYRALFEQAQVETPGFAFVVRSLELDFFRPARMDDVLEIVTWPVAVKGASITLAQEVRRGNDVLVKAAVRVAFICDGKAQPIPKALRLLMKADLE